MFAMAQDARRLIQLALHVGEAMTDAELEAFIAAIDGMAAAVAERPGVVATIIIIVETEHAPTAIQRRRIGEAGRKIARSRDVMITRSPLVRGVMTAIRWFTRGSAHRVQVTFATYAEARTWLVAESGHPASAFDALHDRARDAARRR